MELGFCSGKGSFCCTSELTILVPSIELLPVPVTHRSMIRKERRLRTGRTANQYVW